MYQIDGGEVRQPPIEEAGTLPGPQGGCLWGPEDGKKTAMKRARQRKCQAEGTAGTVALERKRAWDIRGTERRAVAPGGRQAAGRSGRALRNRVRSRDFMPLSIRLRIKLAL